jgi:hypothetical protein
MLNGEGPREGFKSTWQKTILIELGRIEDDEDLLAAARELCKRKPKVREAVALVRRWRLGKARKPARPHDLMMQLARAIDRYRSLHPDATRQLIEQALDDLGRVVSRAFAGKE